MCRERGRDRGLCQKCPAWGSFACRERLAKALAKDKCSTQDLFACFEHCSCGWSCTRLFQDVFCGCICWSIFNQTIENGPCLPLQKFAEGAWVQGCCLVWIPPWFCLYSWCEKATSLEMWCVSAMHNLKRHLLRLSSALAVQNSENADATW